MSRARLIAGCFLLALANLGVWYFSSGTRATEPAAPAREALTPAVASTPAVAANTLDTAAIRNDGSKPLVQLRGTADLVALLQAQSVNAPAAIAAYRDWLRAAGFFPGSLPGIDELLDGADDTLRGLDDKSLEALANQGNLGAIQALAAQREISDPFAALEGYRQATGLGSVFAMLQMSRLLETLSQVRRENLAGDVAFRTALQKLRGFDSNADLKEDALAWAIVALRAGGPPAAGTESVSLLAHSVEGVAADRLAAVCTRAARLQTETLQPAVAAVALPPIFFTAPETLSHVPCDDAKSALENAPQRSGCRAQPIVNGRAERMTLWICPTK